VKVDGRAGRDASSGSGERVERRRRGPVAGRIAACDGDMTNLAGSLPVGKRGHGTAPRACRRDRLRAIVPRFALRRRRASTTAKFRPCARKHQRQRPEDEAVHRIQHMRSSHPEAGTPWLADPKGRPYVNPTFPRGRPDANRTDSKGPLCAKADLRLWLGSESPVSRVQMSPRFPGSSRLVRQIASGQCRAVQSAGRDFA